MAGLRTRTNGVTSTLRRTKVRDFLYSIGRFEIMSTTVIGRLLSSRPRKRKKSIRRIRRHNFTNTRFISYLGRLRVARSFGYTPKSLHNSTWDLRRKNLLKPRADILY